MNTLDEDVSMSYSSLQAITSGKVFLDQIYFWIL